MGSAFSDALEHWSVDAVDHWYAQYLDENPDDRFSLENEPGTTRAMAAAYIKTYAQHEREIAIPSILIGGCSFSGYIDGKLDANTLIEDKFKSMWTPVHEKVLGKDDQVTGYFATYCNQEGLDPEDIKLLYRITKKPGIKQKKTETPEMYFERLYLDVLDRPEFYFIEIEQTRSLKDVSEWWNNTRKIAGQIEASTLADPDEAWPENYTSCVRFNSLCDFWELCSSRDDTELDAVIHDTYQVREK